METAQGRYWQCNVTRLMILLHSKKADEALEYANPHQIRDFIVKGKSFDEMLEVYKKVHDCTGIRLFVIVCGWESGHRRMEQPIMDKKVFRKWIFLILAACLLIAVLILWQYKKQETEYSIIQAIIEKLPDYQNEIEGWGYRVSLLPKMTEEPDHAGFMRYYWETVGPVLILEDQDGGMYCFYYGFDQYISEKTYKENMMLFPAGQYAEKEYEDVLKTVRLQICKRDIRQEPLFENTADAASKDYYDVYVFTEITAKSLEEGNEVSVFGGGFFGTNYCSNNFEECRWWDGIDPTSANSYSDHNIKQEYSAVQLLEYYRQGLELQMQLIELYHERQNKHDK